MNDFTKEELKEIRDSIGSYSRAKWYCELENKIQSMIDNYCQTNGHNYEFSLGRGQCENCGESE